MGGCSYCDKKIEMKLTSYEYREKNINNNNRVPNIENREDLIFAQFQNLSKNNDKNCNNEIIKSLYNKEDDKKEDISQLEPNDLQNNKINNKSDINQIRNTNTNENKSDKQLIKYIKEEHQLNVSKNNKYQKRNTFNKILYIQKDKNTEEMIK